MRRLAPIPTSAASVHCTVDLSLKNATKIRGLLRKREGFFNGVLHGIRIRGGFKVRKKIGAGAKPPREKLDPAFRRCSHCGEVFFRADGKELKNGFICDFCADKGICAVGA